MEKLYNKSSSETQERWYLSAIDYLIIDTQVARRGRQYHSNPPPYKKPSYKSNRPTNIQQERLEKKSRKLKKKKKIDKKTACVLQKANRPTKYTTRKIRTKIEQIKQKKIDKKPLASYKKQTPTKY